MKTVVWVDGRLSSDGTAQIAALDHGLTVGDGVFEACKVIDGQPFALTRHLRRLARSLDLLALPAFDEGTVRDAVKETLDVAMPLPLGRLRITVTAGAGPLGTERADAPMTLVVAATATGAWPSEIAVASVPWTRNERSAIAGAKTTSYAENVVALRAARLKGAHEAVLANSQGMLCEGTGSNVVLAVDGRLVTPPLSCGCLAGITRELLIEWAGQDGLLIEEVDIPFSELARAQDVLLTSSTRDVQPVAVLDGRPLAGGELGRAARDLFVRRAVEGMDP